MQTLLWMVLASSAAAGPLPRLGFAGCGPALFRALPAGEMTVAFSGVAHDASGRVTRFVEEVGEPPSGKPVRATVAVTYASGGACDGVRYAVDIGGRQLFSPSVDEFEAERLEGLIAFSVVDPGVVVLGGVSGTVETTTSRDSLGRSRPSRQGFSHRGTRYEVTYSDFVLDARGRLSGYRAHLRPAGPR